MNKKRILKNISVICSGVFILFTAYDGPTMLQSTMNKEQNIGLISQAIMYGCFCLSAIILPKYVIKKLGSKVTYVISMLTYVPYIAANYYPHWTIMIPASILIGLGAPLLWGSQAKYLNDISTMYAELCFSNKNPKCSSKQTPGKESTKSFQYPVSAIDSCQSYSSNIPRKSVGELNLNNKEAIETNRRHSLACSLVDDLAIILNHRRQSSTLSGNTNSDKIMPFKFITSISLNKEDKPFQQFEFAKKKTKIASVTARVFGIHGMAYLSCHLSGNLLSYFILRSGAVIDNKPSDSICACGSHFCNSYSNCSNKNIDGVSDQTRYTLTSICISLAIISVLIVAFFLDPLETKPEDNSSSLRLLSATVKLAKRTEALLLIPFSFYIGHVQAFYTAEFTKAFVSCSWGTHHVPLVTVSYGFFCALSATSSGWLVKICGRRVVFTIAILLNVTSNTIFLLWNPSISHPEMFFVLAGMWGTFIGIVWSQLRAFYGLLFKSDEDAAFAAFHIWYSLGFCVAFSYSGFFCTFVKIYVSLFISISGYFCYVIVENTHAMKNLKK